MDKLLKLFLPALLLTSTALAQNAQVKDDFKTAIALGNYGSASSILKFGRNADVDTATETVWSAGGTYPWASLATAQALEIVSDNIADDVGSTGCTEAEVQGLDANYDPQTQTAIALDGTTTVDLTGTWLRVFRIKCTAAGSSASNTGTISVQLDGGGQVVAEMPAGQNQSFMAVYTVKAGYTAACYSYYRSVARQTSVAVDFELFVRPFGEVFQAKHRTAVKSDGTTSSKHHFDMPLIVTEKSDIDLRATSAAVNADVSGGFDCGLFRNE